jgi:hypothetical protein
MHEEIHIPPPLVALKEEIDKLASYIEAPQELLPTYVRSIDFAHPHLEWDQEGYHWVVIERGKEMKRISSRDPEDILYQVFQSVTFEMASSFSTRNPDKKEDFRRKLWSHQLELLRRIKPSWAEKRNLEIEAILLKAPFR